jgi:hypothetical protein
MTGRMRSFSSYQSFSEPFDRIFPDATILSSQFHRSVVGTIFDDVVGFGLSIPSIRCFPAWRLRLKRDLLSARLIWKADFSKSAA